MLSSSSLYDFANLQVLGEERIALWETWSVLGKLWTNQVCERDLGGEDEKANIFHVNRITLTVY